jgi:hypothetical protein
MRIKHNGSRTNKATEYTMWLSVSDVEQWVFNKQGCWPCSTLAGHKVRIDVDANGLLDILLDGKGGKWQDIDEGNGPIIDGNEVEAIITDHLLPALRHLWPVWGCRPR